MGTLKVRVSTGPDVWAVVGSDLTTINGDSRYLRLTGGTLTGVLTLNADPSQPLEAATKQYVDNSGGGGGGLDQATADLRYVNIDGDTMTGLLAINPTDGGPAMRLHRTNDQPYFSFAKIDNTRIAYIQAKGGAADTEGLKFQTEDIGSTGYIYFYPHTVMALRIGPADIAAGVPVVLNADPVSALQAAPKQYVDARSSGAGPLLGFNFSTTTTAPPASATVRLNNATPASATAIYVHYMSKDGADLRTRILAGTVGDRLFIQDRDASANYRMYSLTAAPTDNTTYATLAVTHQAGGGTITDAQEVVVGFLPTPITVSNTAPASPLTGDLWIDTT